MSPRPSLIEAASRPLARAVDDGRIPAVVLEVGRAAEVLERLALGTATDTQFDLASLTKVLATGAVAVHRFGTRTLDLDMPVAFAVPAWRGADRESVRLRDLLTHASGLPAHQPLYEHHHGAAAVVHAAATTPLTSPPRTHALYSDLGFIVLGHALERLTGASLADSTTQLLSTLSGHPPAFGPPRPDDVVAATGPSAWRGRLLHGEVHDDNAAAMGGVAGHAGLFGRVDGVGDVARVVLRGLRGDDTALAPAWAMRAFARRSPVPGSSRALAWDTALPTSSSGALLSRHAIGHTGFTGTSLWIDPDLDLYVVLLTNRVAGTATADDMAAIRREVHEALGHARRISPRA